MKTTAAMTIAELAHYLRLPESKLRELAQDGILPGEKVDQVWWFDRTAVDRWLLTSPKYRHSRAHYPETHAAVGQFESCDIEEYQALLNPWDVKLSPLTNGRIYNRLEYTKLPGVIVYREKWLRSTRTQGTPPEGFFIIGTYLDCEQSQLTWCGHTVDYQHFACARGGQAIEFTSPKEAHYAVMLIEPKVLQAAVGAQAVDLVGRRKHLDFSITDGSRLANAILGIVGLTRERPSIMNDPKEVAHVQSWLLDNLIACLSHLGNDEETASDSVRRAAVAEAMDLVNEASAPITAMELAAAVGVSQRTLENGFREQFGITPAKYLHRFRLNMARRALAEADPRSISVIDTAFRWGFSHPGRFSDEYQRMFGEKPSVTLKRARNPAKSQLTSLLQWV